MNGVKNKFSNENVLDIFKNFDLLCVSETRFGYDLNALMDLL